jgi:hypothetical protein
MGPQVERMLQGLRDVGVAEASSAGEIEGRLRGACRPGSRFSEPVIASGAVLSFCCARGAP